MAMEITNNYGSYASQYIAGNSSTNGMKKKDTEQTAEPVNSGKSKSTAEYMSELAKLVPSVELKVGNSFQTAKSGKTLTINPQLLEKMQNDPEKEKEMKELIKGVESAVNMLDSVMNASGWSVVFKHDYIDENGKYRQIALVRNDFMLNMSDKLREERRQNSEKLIEKTKEKAAEKKEEIEEYLKGLQKQIPYMKLQIGYGVNTKNDGKVDVLDINPKLLEKMRNDPKAEKEYTERLKDVESAHKFVDNFLKATGSTVICSHAYVDENGNYCNFTVSVRKDALNEKLRKEAQENAEKQIEKSRENARKNTKKTEERLDEKEETLLSERVEAAKEENQEKANHKKPATAGSHFDMRI